LYPVSRPAPRPSARAVLKHGVRAVNAGNFGLRGMPPLILFPRAGMGGFRGFGRGLADAASILAEQSSDQTNPFLTPAYYATVAAQNNNECAVDPSSSACAVWQDIQAPTIAQTNLNATQLDLKNWCEQNAFDVQQFGDAPDTASCSGSTPLPSVVAAAAAQGVKAPAYQMAAGSQPGLTTSSASSTPASVTLTNVSRPGQPLAAGDGFLLTIKGAPNSPVVGSASQNGTSLGSTPWGNTDSTGVKQINGTMSAPNVGNWVETWTVGGGPPANLSFSVSASPGSPAGGGAPAGGGGGGGTPTPAPAPAAAAAPAFDLSFLTNTVPLFGFNVPVWALGAAAVGGVVIFSSMGKR
jgi:hypothetical protein